MYDALKKMLSLKDKLRAASDVLDIPELFRNNDFEYIQQYVKCMSPIAEAIDLLQGEKKCHYGYLLPTLKTTRRKIEAIRQRSTNMSCSSLVLNLVQGIKKRFHKLFSIKKEGKSADIGAVTHPLFEA